MKNDFATRYAYNTFRLSWFCEWMFSADILYNWRETQLAQLSKAQWNSKPVQYSSRSSPKHTTMCLKGSCGDISLLYRGGCTVVCFNASSASATGNHGKNNQTSFELRAQTYLQRQPLTVTTCRKPKRARDGAGMNHPRFEYVDRNATPHPPTTCCNESWISASRDTVKDSWRSFAHKIPN